MFNYTMMGSDKCEFVEIAPASELPNGERLFVEVGGREIVIFNIADRRLSQFKGADFSHQDSRHFHGFDTLLENNKGFRQP